MARFFHARCLFLFVPALLVVLAVVTIAGLAFAHAQGWRWQGLAWRNGLVLERLSLRDGDCARLLVEDVRLYDIWPLRASVGRVAVRDCGAGGASSDGFSIPPAPPFDFTVQSLQIYAYPEVSIAVHHRGARWWGQISKAGSHVRARYRADRQRWQLSGHIAVTDVSTDYSGTFTLQGQGHWRPQADAMARRFAGRLGLEGHQLGRTGQTVRGDVQASLNWQGLDWNMAATLTRPVALGNGWVIRPEQGIHATGTGLTLQQVDAVLTVQGPRLRAEMVLHNKAGQPDSGRGHIALSHGANGRIELTWADDTVTVQPFRIDGPQGIVLALEKTLHVPVARQGSIRPMFSVTRADARIFTTRSHVRWQGADVSWAGSIQFAGSWRGQELSGGWSGSINRDGVRGQPLLIRLDGDVWALQARLAAAQLWPLTDPLTVELAGRYLQQNVTATVTAASADAGWAGHVRANMSLQQADQGGRLALTGDWRWQDGLVLAAGTRLTMTRALFDDVLVEAGSLAATTPLEVGAHGVQGRLQLQSDGVMTTRWTLPPLQAGITLVGWGMTAAVKIPEWDGALMLQGHHFNKSPAGTFQARLPLQPAVSRGLGFVTRGGVLTAGGSWHIDGTPGISGHVQANDVGLDWGGIAVTGLQADLAVNWAPGDVWIRDREPVTVAKLALGVPVTDIRFGMNSDLHTWRLYDVSARVLGGRMSAMMLAWPSAVYQPVVVSGVDVAQVVALQSEPVVEASGQVGGILPLRLLRTSLAVEDGHLYNETTLHMNVPETESILALKQTNQAVRLAMDVISSLRIHDFSANIDMNADGLLKAAMTIKGINPQLGQPIVLNYTHKENMFDLLRNLRISDRVVDTVVGDHAVVETPAKQ